MIYFNLGPHIIQENCKFAYYFNKTDITPMVLDGSNKIILANWPNDVICNVNNDIPFKIPSFGEYKCIMQLWNRSRK